MGRRSHPCDAAVGYDHPRIALGRAVANQREAFESGDFGSVSMTDEQSKQESSHRKVGYRVRFLASSMMRVAREGLKTPQEQNRAR